MADVPEPKEDVHVKLPGASDDGEDGHDDDEDGSFTLRNINFSVKAGELLCVIGRVGSGKSSLVSLHSALRMLHAEVIASSKPWRAHGQSLTTILPAAMPIKQRFGRRDGQQAWLTEE